MGFPTVLLAIALTAPPQLAVLDVKPRFGVAPELASGLTDIVLAEVRRLHHTVNVVGMDQVRALLVLQKQKQQLGCDSVGCLAEIGGSLGARRLVTGSLSRFGTVYALSLQLIDVRNAQVINDVSQQVSGKEEELLRTATALVGRLFPTELAMAGPPPNVDVAAPALSGPPATAVTQVSESKPSHPRPLFWVCGSLGVTAGGVAIVGLVEALSFTGWQNQPKGTYLPVTTAQTNVNTANAWATVGLVSGILAVGGVTTAVITW